jgi:uncharacterized glyoxalase superfamily metalloenzyme YdcJ
LDIDRAQALMPECGIEPKALIEGPPRREVPIAMQRVVGLLIDGGMPVPAEGLQRLLHELAGFRRGQALMPECGIEPKALIEGPPRREVPILLRQTSFKAAIKRCSRCSAW